MNSYMKVDSQQTTVIEALTEPLKSKLLAQSRAELK